MDAAGSCYGFGLRSELAFEFLRGGSGPPLTVVAAVAEPALATTKPLLEWVIRRDGVFHARLFEDGHRFRLWVADSGWYTVDPHGPSISLPENGNAVKREARLWGIPTLLCSRARGDLTIHAAAVEVGGGAVLLAAPGTFGKTTLALAFARVGHRVLSEDLSCLRFTDEPAVAPGPALLRVRRDIAERLDLPAGRRLDGGDDRVYVALDDGGRGDSLPVPLRAIVLLRPGSHSVALEPVDAAHAIRDLWALTFVLPTQDDRTRCFERVADLADRVPVWNLSRPVRLDALAETVERLVAAV